MNSVAPSQSSLVSLCIRIYFLFFCVCAWSYFMWDDSFCHESGSWPSIRLPQEVASPSCWLSHHTDCYMSLWTTVPIIHCTDYTHAAECSDNTYTAESNHTRFISLGLPLSDRRVLSCVYLSPSDSCITEPFRGVIRIFILDSVSHFLSDLRFLSDLIVHRSKIHSCSRITLMSCPCHTRLLLFDPACVLTMFTN